MSTEPYYPNGIGTLPEYKIGTEGWEFNDSNRPNNILDYARDYTLAAIRTIFPRMESWGSGLEISVY